MPKVNRHAKGIEKYTARQVDFALRYYIPTSPTYESTYRSALAAGYSKEYARCITSRGLPWVKEIIKDILGKPTEKRNMVDKAKRVLDRSLDSNDERLAQDTAKFIAKTTAEFSEKSDVTSGGQSIAPVALVEFVDGSTPTTKD